MLTKIETHAPVARTERLALCRPVDIDGRGKRGIVAFEETIHWLREAEARGVFLHGGLELQTVTAFGDHTYGHLSCLHSALDEAKDAATRFKVGPDSTLRLDVVATVREMPVLADPDSEPFFKGRRCYTEVPRDWLLLFDDEMAQSLNEDAPYDSKRRLAPMTVLERVIWSSAHDDETNLALLEQFKADAKAGLPSQT